MKGREGDPHRDTIPFGHGKVEGREGERGGPSQGHNTIRPWQSGREGGRERATLTETQYHSAMAKWKGGRERGGGPHRATIPFSHINQLTEPD